jgi:hypothetical protein
LFSPDDDPPRAARQWMLVRARLVNDVTLRPVNDDVRLESDLPRTTSRVADDGIVGVVAVPREVFPVLAGRNFTFNLTFHARGFLSQTLPVVIPFVQKTTANPLPVANDHIITLNDTVNLDAGEMLMVGPGTMPNGTYEYVRILAIGPGANQVSLRPPLRVDHSTAPEPVIAVVPANFGPTELGDVLLVPQP